MPNWEYFFHHLWAAFTSAQLREAMLERRMRRLRKDPPRTREAFEAEVERYLNVYYYNTTKPMWIAVSRFFLVGALVFYLSIGLFGDEAFFVAVLAGAIIGYLYACLAVVNRASAMREKLRQRAYTDIYGSGPAPWER